MTSLERSRPGSLVALAVTGVAVGAMLGALANTINGWVSPLYFRNIMGWDEVDNLWRASVAQGILEGLIFGLLFSVIFTTVVGIVSRARCPYLLGLRYVVMVAVFAMVCWAIGGLIAMGLATLSPEFYRHAFRGVPENFGSMLRYAWVGGSIWGIQFGGFAFLVLGSVLFRAKWRQLQDAAAQPRAGS